VDPSHPPRRESIGQFALVKSVHILGSQPRQPLRTDGGFQVQVHYARTMPSWLSHVLRLTMSRMPSSHESRNAITVIELGLKPSSLSLRAYLRAFLASPLRYT